MALPIQPPRGLGAPGLVWDVSAMATRKKPLSPSRATPKRSRSRVAPTAAKAPPGVAARRADFGAPIDAFFERQPPHLRVILEELRRLVEAAAPDAVASIKWGMPWFTLNGHMMCSLGGHKAHVNLILVGPSGAFADPDGRLEGTSRGGRHLKLRSVEALPRAAVTKWIRVAADVARHHP